MEEALKWAARIVLFGMVYCVISHELGYETWRDKLVLLCASLGAMVVLVFLTLLLWLAFPGSLPG